MRIGRGSAPTRAQGKIGRVCSPENPGLFVFKSCALSAGRRVLQIRLCASSEYLLSRYGDQPRNSPTIWATGELGGGDDEISHKPRSEPMRRVMAVSAMLGLTAIGARGGATAAACLVAWRRAGAAASAWYYGQVDHRPAGLCACPGCAPPQAYYAPPPAYAPRRRRRRVWLPAHWEGG